MAASPETDRRDALVERLFEAVLGFNDLHAVYIGDRLGLYAALAGGASTPPEVATAAGCDERYVREWLEHQAVGGILEVEDGPQHPTSAATGSLPATTRSCSTATASTTWQRSFE